MEATLYFIVIQFMMDNLVKVAISEIPQLRTLKLINIGWISQCYYFQMTSVHY